MRVLVTNDDGLEAPGLAALAGVAAGLGPVWVIAPLQAQSCGGHAVTTGTELLVRPVPGRPEGWYGVRGTPADCVRLAVSGLLCPAPELVLSGINQGGNLGMDVFYSGTVAAAREAACQGKIGVAVSQYTRPEVPIDWGWAAKRAGEAVRDILDRLAALDSSEAFACYWNVNLPLCLSPDQVPARLLVAHDVRPLPLELEELGVAAAEGGRSFANRGVYHHRLREPGGDVAVVFGGAVAITPLQLRTSRVGGA